MERPESLPALMSRGKLFCCQRFHGAIPLLLHMSLPELKWPNGKQFAFTIFDDTDAATLSNVPPVYEFLASRGFRTTKSVWPVRGTREPICGGETCEDDPYLEWIYRLRQQGFEIGYHMTTYHSSLREETRAGLDRFASLFGSEPITMANHSGCEENIYWGSRRLSGLNRVAYDVLTRFRFHTKYRGDIEDDKFFWGDLCAQRVKYVRNFVTSEINTLKTCPWMPYHDPRRPYVKNWYASSEGPKLASFVQTLAEANQDRLEEEGGACIMYAHLASGFYENGALNGRFKMLMERLSRKNGWFVPVGTLLDYLKKQQGEHILTDAERNQLERTWLRHKMRVGRS